MTESAAGTLSRLVCADAYPPTSGQIADGWLHGRGSNDSKAGAAIFARIAARLVPVSGVQAG